MSSLTDRLRGVIAAHGARSFPAPISETLPRDFGADAASCLGGQWVEVNGGRFVVIDRRYVPGHRHGRTALADCLPPESGTWPCLDHLSGGAGLSARRLLFFDLETTGLAGGAGTYAFLVGCGWFDGESFRVRQFLLSHFGSECGLLQAFADLAAGAGLVTFNGRTFDLPLIDTRFALHRLRTPFDDVPHLDMLPVARRLWRQDDAECRLVTMERTLLGHERTDDVPGFEIPSRYFHFVRSGDATALEAVLEHNRADLVSLAMLTAIAARLFDEGPHSASTPREALGMGQCYQRVGRWDEALQSFRLAVRLADVHGSCAAHALRAHAALCRRMRRYEEAAESWCRLLELGERSSAAEREATEALAIHFEHRTRDLGAARTFALNALRLEPSQARQQAARHRLARLDRKLRSEPGTALAGPALFPLES